MLYMFIQTCCHKRLLLFKNIFSHFSGLNYVMHYSVNHVVSGAGEEQSVNYIPSTITWKIRRLKGEAMAHLQVQQTN